MEIASRKFDRFRQKVNEKLGSQEVMTTTSEEFKALETEMNLRHEGMDRLQKSMNLYVQAMAKRKESDDRDKLLPIGHLGATLVNHGQDFQPDSEFGNCLMSLGRANEAIARKQETYVVSATTTWLESTERSLAQMKEYQNARKKLEQRRLAYDTSLSKMQKAKKEDFRIEEELRAQKAKYEEANEDVYRRMEDIREAEVESVADLTAFLEAELAYYNDCRDILVQLKREWPAQPVSAANGRRPAARSRSNTGHSYSDRFDAVEEEPAPKPQTSRISSIRESPSRPAYNRAVTTDDSFIRTREYSPTPSANRLSRIPTEPAGMLARAALRPVPANRGADIDDDSSVYSNGRSDSPTASLGRIPSRNTSWSTEASTGGKKAPPPPPPSRAKKPPPPPPMKRSSLSTSEIPQSPH